MWSKIKICRHYVHVKSQKALFCVSLLKEDKFVGQIFEQTTHQGNIITMNFIKEEQNF